MTNKEVFASKAKMIVLLGVCMEALDDLMDLCETDNDFKFYLSRYNSLKLKRNALEDSLYEL